MKIAKFLAGTTLLGAVAVATFNITYERVSAIEMEKAKEEEKKKIVYRPITIREENTKKEEIVEDVDTGPKLNTKTNNFIFIGDARLDTLRNISSNYNFDYVKFISAENADCDWMRNGGLSELNNILNTTSQSYNIVFNPGISDLGNIQRYADFFNNLANEHPNHNIFVLDVFPLDEIKAEENNLNVTNNDYIYDFNIDLKKSLNENAHIIYAFQELILNGYETIDGYYLTEDTSNRLLGVVYEHIKSLQVQ